MWVTEPPGFSFIYHSMIGSAILLLRIYHFQDSITKITQKFEQSLWINCNVHIIVSFFNVFPLLSAVMHHNLKLHVQRKDLLDGLTFIFIILD